MRVRHAASGIAVVIGTARRDRRLRASQLRAALRLEQAGQHLRHDHRVRGAESAQLRAHRRGRRERQDAGVRVRIARRHAAHAQRRHAADPEGRHEDPGHRLAVAAQSVHVLLRHRRARRRPRAQRQRTHRTAAGGGGAAAAQGHLRHLAAGADRQPQHQRPAADDSVDDAGRREGRRRLRSVQGRSDVPLRSGRDPPRVGRAGHAARDRARRATTWSCVTSGWTCAASST